MTITLYIFGLMLLFIRRTDKYYFLFWANTTQIEPDGNQPESVSFFHNVSSYRNRNRKYNAHNI